MASASPQRRAILDQLGVPHVVAAQDVEELEAGEPAEVALENARRKASAARRAADGRLVLACDTVVALDGRLYGKPRDAAHARETLAALAGRTHDVVSGVVLGDRQATAVTRVTFRAAGEALLDWYVATGEWQGRAGGYAIQGRGAALVAAIVGDYLNVVGLPVAALLDLAPELLVQASSDSTSSR
ncbi:MAG TPA: Maf family protein [Baekduia sp.]|nr:Maf family protein [Baekduia sp.]